MSENEWLADVADEGDGWLCDCGAWVDEPYHCPGCMAEPPWGCACDWCQGDRYLDDDENEEAWDHDEYFDPY